MAVGIFQQTISKIQRLERKLSSREADLQQVGKKCHQVNSEVSQQNESLHREALILKEEK